VRERVARLTHDRALAPDIQQMVEAIRLDEFA
jgi:histidine ammonia-lyase